MAVRANIEEAEKGLMMKQQTTAEEEMAKIRETQWYSHFKPKVGSVFPAKRKSVKRMMFDLLVAYFGSFVSHSSPPSSSAVASQLQT